VLLGKGSGWLGGWLWLGLLCHKFEHVVSSNSGEPLERRTKEFRLIGGKGCGVKVSSGQSKENRFFCFPNCDEPFKGLAR